MLYIFAMLSYGLDDPSRRYVVRERCIPAMREAFEHFTSKGNHALMLFWNNDRKVYITTDDWNELNIVNSPANLGVEAYNHCFKGSHEDDVLVEMDSTSFIRNSEDISKFMKAFHAMDEEYDPVGFVGMDYYIPTKSRDHWHGAESFGMSHIFVDGAASIIKRPYGKFSLYTKGCEKGLVFGGFRACRNKTWNDIGGQRRYLYGSDRLMNQVALDAGYYNMLLHNICIEKFTNASSEYREWKQKYLTHNCIIPENEDGEVWDGGRREQYE